MTHQEILEKAIKKAIEGGWKSEISIPLRDIRVSTSPDYGTVVEIRWCSHETDGDNVPPQDKGFTATIPSLLYDESFAKALWGEFTEADHNHAEKKLYETASKLDHKKAEAILSQGVLEPWQYHLMQMVISDDPIEYLGDNI